MRRIEQYRVARGHNLADPAYWNGRLEDIDLRIHARETSDSALEGAVQRVEELGVERVAATLNPLVEQAITKLSDVPDLFDATSGTGLTVARAARRSSFGNDCALRPYLSAYDRQ
jgi:hypothetical protein